ncbi:galactose-3-O-sulfotransferase 4-like [Macrobrachium nipponense]|uniref:galactose-3-O-sulfotransferase 4-like n=1 Tax=Macrobrachium nipponense TaxID=159736 RepID=UPI0030C8D0F9
MKPLTMLKTMITQRYLRALILFLAMGAVINLLLSSSDQPTNNRFGIFSGDSSQGGLGGNGPARCSSQDHIMFLKTHKCASSTVQNIFLRYGFKHNLSFALPEIGNYLGNPKFFTAKLVPRSLLPPSGKVDIFAVHTRLNVPEHSMILHNDSRWVTIVRDPSTLYESLYNFFHMGETFGIELSQYNTQSMKRLESLPRWGGKFGKNQMLFDLGYPDNMSVPELSAAIDSLDKRFDLVMVSEFMDESLVLLRHLLCWSLHDVVYFTKNARREEVKPTLRPEVLSALSALNRADVLLYDHFLAKHRQAVEDFGAKRMADEVSALRSLRDEYFQDCGTHEVQGRDKSLKFKEYSGLVSAYVSSNNSNQNCWLLTLPELHLLATLRSRQRESLLKLNESSS